MKAIEGNHDKVFLLGLLGAVVYSIGWWPAGLSGWSALAVWIGVLVGSYIADGVMVLVALLTEARSDLARTDERIAEVNRRLMDIEHLLDMRLTKSEFE